MLEDHLNQEKSIPVGATTGRKAFNIEGVSIYYQQSTGTKCPRCWKHIDFDASTADSHPCEAVVPKAELLAAAQA